MDDQLSPRALAVKAAFDVLSPRERMELSARLTAAVVALQAPSPIALKEAASRAHRSPQVVATWCYRHGLGIKQGGRWAVDPARLDTFLAGGRP